MRQQLEVNGLKIGLKPVVWSVITLAMLLFLRVPGVNVIALLLMMVPYTMLYTLLSRKQFALYIIVTWLVAAIILGPSSVLLIGMFFLLPGIVMGHLYRSGASSIRIIPIVTVVILAEFMLELLVLEVILKASILGNIKHTLFDITEKGVLTTTFSSDMLEDFTTAMLNMIPLAFMILAFIVVSCSHYVARRIAAKNGLEVLAFPEAKDWKLPRSLVTIYLIAYVIQLFINPLDNSFMSVALMNLVPALSYIFAFQAIGFFFYLGDQKGWPKVIPLIIAVPIIFIPPLSLIGVIDTAFPLRKNFSKHK